MMEGVPPEPTPEEQPHFTCPDCGFTSYHPEDIKHRYCANCHEFK
jgi:ribosomal protein L37E